MKNSILKTMLFERGISQKSLARETGINEAIISLGISGRYVFDSIQQKKISDALKEQVENIFTEKVNSMEKAHDEALSRLKEKLVRDYENSDRLREEYETVDDYIRWWVDRMFLENEFEKSQSLKAEFGEFGRYLAFKMAEEQGKVKIIGHKLVSV